MTAPRTRILASLATVLGLVASGFVAHVAPQGESVWHGVTGAPSAVRLIGAIVAGIAVWMLGRVADVRPFFLMITGLLPIIPAVSGLGSGLLLFSGFTMLLVFAIAAGWAARDLIPRIPALGTISVFLISFAFFVLVGRFVPGPAGPQGDEPHYLMIAESLLHDGDVDLKNQFDEAAFSKFTSGRLEPHTAPRTPRGTLYAIHTPGLSALVLPGYAVGSYAGARAILSALMAIVVCLLFTTARAVFGTSTATFVFLAATFASPLPIYANSLFPDSAAALAVAASLACLTRMTPTLLSLASLAIAGLPWLHPRFLPLAALLATVLALKGGFSARRAAVAFVPLAVSTALLLLHFHAVFGSVSLSAAYGPSFASDVSLARIPWGATALLLDRQFGLLLFAPLLLFGLAGLAPLWKRDRMSAVMTIAVVGMALGIGGAFSMWWGGASAPARFLIAATPALLFLCATAWHGAENRPARRALLGAAAGFGAGIVWLACLAPRALHNRSDGDSGLLRLMSPVLDIDRLFPSFVTGTCVRLALPWAIALVMLWIRPYFGLALALAPLIAATLLGPKPLLDPFASSLRLLESWDDRRRCFGGVDDPDALHLDVPLGAASWELIAGKIEYSPRFSLPSGWWTLTVESEGEGTPGASNLARVNVVSDEDGENVLASTLVVAAERLATTTFRLPNDERRLRLRGDGIQSNARILAVRLTPEKLER